MRRKALAQVVDMAEVPKELFHEEHTAEQRPLEQPGLALSMVAHEVRNALTPVRSQCELALLDRPTGRAKSALESAARACIDAVEAMQAILDASVAAATSPNRTDLAEAIESVVGSIGSSTNVAITVPRGTWCDAPRAVVKVVFGNLIRNALEATPGRDTRVTIHASQSGSTVQVRVQDNGHGLPSATHANPFIPFQRSASGGAGLGLAISANLLQAHGATLTLESTGSNGTTWLILLPLATNENSAAA